MTLAALLITLFFLPGFIFSLAYYNSESIPLNISLTHKAVASLFLTVILHAIGFAILIYCFGEVFNFNMLLMLLSSAQPSIVSAVTNDAIIVAVIYLLFNYTIAFAFGLMLRRLIKATGLDRFNFFRIDNPWYDLFKGLSWKDGQPDGVKIASTVQIAGNSYLYVGVLENFFLDREGNIDRLVLVSASRRHLANDKGTLLESKRFYPIDGQYLVLKYNEIKNLNVEYFNVIDYEGKFTIQYVTPKE
jgi:hypothetical protein